MQTIDLPCDPEGKVNWDVLGKMLTAKLLGEVVYASHIDKKHASRQSMEGVLPDTEWEFCYEKDEVAVLRKKTERTCFMGRGVVNRPPSVVAEFVKDVQSSFVWDNLVVEARYVKVLQESPELSDYIGYQLFETIQHCGLINIKRDMLYYAHCVYTTDGKYVLSGMSIEDPDFPPHQHIPRMTMHMGTGFVAESYHGDPEKTLLSYVAHIDTKGIPSLVNSQVLKRHPMAVSRIRKSLEGGRGSVSPPQSSSLPSSPLHSIRQSSRHYEDGLGVRQFIKEKPLT